MNKLLLLVFCFFLISCYDDEINSETPNYFDENISIGNKVLMLKVDCLTHTFEAAKQYDFETNAETFSIRKDDQAPGDFGFVKLYYNELDQLLFHGTIYWMGNGEIKSPTEMIPSNQFQMTQNENTVIPINGFENIFDQDPFDFTPAWNAVQKLNIVRNYLAKNPNQKVKYFLYTPTSGMSNVEDKFSWIIFLKN